MSSPRGVVLGGMGEMGTEELRLERRVGYGWWGQTGGWTDGRADRRTDGRTDGGWMDGWVDGWIDEMDRRKAEETGDGKKAKSRSELVGGFQLGKRGTEVSWLEYRGGDERIVKEVMIAKLEHGLVKVFTLSINYSTHQAMTPRTILHDLPT